ncbi:MAG TPA: TraB/GumN family protein [Flavipsychrobacter sp.]|nr:TraB/GumN family protein [Flavipsychrobacter sp.]
MRKVWMLLCGCLSMFFSGRAEEKTDTPFIAIKEKSLLWKISGKDMKQSSYVFGTMHLICKDDYLWTLAMKKSLKAAKEVCFEMDMDDPNVLLQIAAGMIDNTGKRLSDYFTPEEYKLVSQYFSEQAGLDATMIEQLKPAALVNLLATSGFNCSNMVSYETNIMDEAKKMRIEVTGLEEPREQLALLESFSADSITKEIIQLLQKNVSSDTNEYHDMVTAYRRQDISALYEMMSGLEQSGIRSQTFLAERNEKWIERMEERMDQKPVFFAIGAGHLGGEKGVINLLRKKGYKVQAVIK